MPRSASAVGLAKRGVIPRKQFYKFYSKMFLFNTVILSKMEKRTYGIRNLTRGPRAGTWELIHQEVQSAQSKTIEAPNRKRAPDILAESRKQLDRQQHPGVKVPCCYLFELHLTDMRRMQRDAKNIVDQEKKMNKYLRALVGWCQTRYSQP
jgi:hypothetical protein